MYARQSFERLQNVGSRKNSDLTLNEEIYSKASKLKVFAFVMIFIELEQLCMNKDLQLALNTHFVNFSTEFAHLVSYGHQKFASNGSLRKANTEKVEISLFVPTRT